MLLFACLGLANAHPAVVAYRIISSHVTQPYFISKVVQDLFFCDVKHDVKFWQIPRLRQVRISYFLLNLLLRNAHAQKRPVVLLALILYKTKSSVPGFVH